MTYKTDEQDKAITRIQTIIEEYERDKFDDAELEILHKMIELYKAFGVFGRVANVIRNVCIYVGGIFIAYFFLADIVASWWKK